MSKRRRPLFENKEHLLRMAVIFAAGIAVFLTLQLALVPKSFGVYGHYRAAALDEEAKKGRAFGGRASCARCHPQQVETLKGGKHLTLGCEACHGALAAHAASRGNVAAADLDAKKLCPVCHEKNVARPAWFKQVDTREHSGGEACDTCHQPHAPQM
jgi:hypothetical protein